jgi:hypothetical protein
MPDATPAELRLRIERYRLLIRILGTDNHARERLQVLINAMENQLRRHGRSRCSDRPEPDRKETHFTERW